MNVNNSTIDSATLIPDVRSTLWNFNITNNEFLGGFIKPNGTALSKRAYIIGNDFQFPVGGDPATTLYLPIDDTNFNVTGETVSYYNFANDNPSRPVAYNVMSKDNTPWRYNFPPADITVGTVVAQTNFEIIVVDEDSLNPPLFNLGNWCLKPYIANGQVFASLQVGSLILDSTIADGGQQISFEHFINITGVALPRVNLNQWSETGNAEPSGYSCKFSLYPQRNI